jgi:hypothetical protein
MTKAAGRFDIRDAKSSPLHRAQDSIDTGDAAIEAAAQAVQFAGCENAGAGHGAISP